MSNVISDFVIGFYRAISSATVGDSGITIDLEGLGSIGFDDDDDDVGEGVTSELFGPLGLIGKPLPPETIGGKTRQAEVFGAKLADDALPLAWRDLRLNEAFPGGLSEGQLAFVGYGGGFHSIERTSVDSGDQRASIHVIYAPYEFSNGTPAKAMAIVIDTENESIGLVHGDGYWIGADATNGIVLRADKNTFLAIKAGEISMVANKVSARGNFAAGKDTSLAVALNASSASTSVFFTP